MNEIRSFKYNNSTYYAACYWWDKIYLTCGTSLANLGVPKPAFTPHGSADRYLATCGWVLEGNTILGILYGGCPVPEVNRLQIFARWLQKKIVFKNAYVHWDENYGLGPEQVRLPMSGGSQLETGNFLVYDTDGTTLLYTSPTVTMRAGDAWNYSPVAPGSSGVEEYANYQ